MKHSIKHMILIFFTSIGLLSFIGCTQQEAPLSGLTPMPDMNDLSDAQLTNAITAHLKQRGAPAYSTYDFVRSDLNGDGRREGVVFITLPYRYWCGWAGCTLFVFTPKSDTFQFVSETRNIRGPIYIAPPRSNDQNLKPWRDLIVRASGTNVPDRTVILSHDGSGYPENSLNAPPYTDEIDDDYFEKIFR